MQTQHLRMQTQSISQTQSLAAVQTLLRAGLGSITFLRSFPLAHRSPCLLIIHAGTCFLKKTSHQVYRLMYPPTLSPDPSFAGHFTSIDGSDHESSEWSLSQTDGSFEGNTSHRIVNSFKTMTSTQELDSHDYWTNQLRVTQTIARGYTDEGDKILNYLHKEYGIFDALDKRYLRSFIFAIYLYCRGLYLQLQGVPGSHSTRFLTLNIRSVKYHTILGSDIVVPVMSLADGLGSSTRRNVEDPVTKAIKNGKPPTLKDVKNSVKVTSVADRRRHVENTNSSHASHGFAAHKERRFATFKVFYTEDTPPDYEPPNFQAGDVDKDRWYFMTHDLDEIPERCSIGKFNAGHHSVKLSVTSIASYLPSSTVHDNATFSGITSQPGRQALTPVQEADIRNNQAKKQLEDAEHRNLLWAVEELGDEDADGEDDPDYTKDAYGQCVPVGIRNKTGQIEAIPEYGQTIEEHFSGLVEHIPKRLHEIVCQEVPKDVQIDETQPLLLTPEKKCSQISIP
ncbi:LOW QUALITY PROTEIN: hypothetical protein CVT25_015520 [Psilocybe cyanescens]|uniref:HORMA domain-containing protein n=1 Tax=Psilocybe cyanescens TaxID=93625 RepID=A0A409WI44_PSICY|nr:LOW QUALITY PROTEIN: hypothetical protein CVT25_015520 [Psilocybe cyanescens]